MSKFMRRLGRGIINRLGRICGCTAKSPKKSYQSESGGDQDSSRKQSHEKHPSDEEASSEVTYDYGYEELDEGSSSKSESSGKEYPSDSSSMVAHQEIKSDNLEEDMAELKGIPSASFSESSKIGENDEKQEKHECKEEASSEVTYDYGYEELEEGSSASSESSGEVYPSSSQSSMEQQEVQFDNQTEGMVELKGIPSASFSESSNIGESNEKQEKHECEEEASSEVTYDYGYEELEEGSSSWSESSGEVYPSSSQSSVVHQEIQYGNLTESLAELKRIPSVSFSESSSIGENSYEEDQMPTETQDLREIEDSSTLVEVSHGTRLDSELEESLPEVVTSTPTPVQNIVNNSEALTTVIDCDIIQVMDALLDQVEEEMKNPAEDVLTDNQGESDLNTHKEAESSSQVSEPEGRPAQAADLK